VTAVLFAVGKFAIGLYLGKSTVASAFGAAGSLAVMMVWVYYSAQIFLLGAEFTWVYAHAYGSRRGERRPRPEDSASVAPRSPDGPSHASRPDYRRA
jgi:membrane protein